MYLKRLIIPIIKSDIKKIKSTKHKTLKSIKAKDIIIKNTKILKLIHKTKYLLILNINRMSIINASLLKCLN